MLAHVVVHLEHGGEEHQREDGLLAPCDLLVPLLRQVAALVQVLPELLPADVLCCLKVPQDILQVRQQRLMRREALLDTVLSFTKLGQGLSGRGTVLPLFLPLLAP